MTRPAARCLAALALGAFAGACGLGGSADVVQEFQLGGPLPGAGTQVTSAAITQPLTASAGDLDKLSKVTLTAGRLESTDGKDLAFLDQGGRLFVQASGKPTLDLASFAAPGAVGRVDLTVSGVDLKPYLQSGGAITLELGFSSKPVTARGLKLTLTLRGEL